MVRLAIDDSRSSVPVRTRSFGAFLPRNVLPKIYYYPRVTRVYEYVIANIEKPLPLCDLAGVAGMELTSLCRFFRCKIGLTPKELIACGKVAFAAELLHDTDYSTGEVAARIGMSTGSLRRAVKRVTGHDFATFKAAAAPDAVAPRAAHGKRLDRGGR